MPDFHENGVKRCARLQSKKSVSGAVKKISRGSVVAENVEGRVDSTPPPAFLGLKVNSTDIEIYLNKFNKTLHQIYIAN